MNKLQKTIASVFRIPLMTTLRSPANWFMEALGYSKSASGIDVSHNKTLGLSPYFCGLRMISETVGSLPLNVYKRRPTRGQDIWRDHPAHMLLHSEPNPEMTAMSFRQTICAHAIGYGNAYAEIVRRNDGMPAQLWPLPPDRVKPWRDENLDLWYQVRLENGNYAYIPAADMLHIPGLGFDGLVGYSLIKVACESIGINLAQEEYSARFFSNGGHVSLVAETDNTLSDATFDRLKSELAKKIGGLDNAHRVALLEAGIKLKTLNISNVDAQLLEGKRFSVEEWARWLNIPPHKLKEMTHSTFSNIEHQNIEWVVDTIRPWLVRFEQEYNRKLFRQKNLFYSKHVVDGLLRGDQKSRYEAYAVARNWGWMSANDILELEDRNPLPGDVGDIYLSPGNMTRAEDAGAQMNDAPQQDADQTREEELTRDAASRIVGYEFRRQMRGESYAHTQDFVDMVAQWMKTTKDTAEKYASITANNPLVNSDIPEDEAMQSRIDLLTDLVMKGKQYETA